MAGVDLVAALTSITVLALLLCIIGIGVFALPVVALLWTLYFASSMTVGGGIAVAGVAIAAAAIYWVRHQTK